MKNDKGFIFDIKRMALHDGPGIRTTVFLKGCNMSCKWCHNPESISSKLELLFNASKCIMCRKCKEVCERGVHEFMEERHIVNREKCNQCGDCARECPSQALEMCGEGMSVTEVMNIVMRDEIFYKNSGGGITISGGEPLCQPDFTFALLKEAKKRGLHTVLDTNGNYSWEKIEPMLPYIDLIRFDLKHINSDIHRSFTGTSNSLILENLRRLAEDDHKLVVSYPMIPGVNDSIGNLKNMMKIIKALPSRVCVDVVPYHDLYLSKLEKLGKKRELIFLRPSQEKVSEVEDFFKEEGVEVC
ncbi:MAG: glycyl-radical enzyme activating protein [Actinobacteria bacterium]|nr:glycyl-radical enzyme activating protein [Actinomycetota bacterium]